MDPVDNMDAGSMDVSEEDDMEDAELQMALMLSAMEHAPPAPSQQPPAAPAPPGGALSSEAAAAAHLMNALAAALVAGPAAGGAANPAALQQQLMQLFGVGGGGAGAAGAAAPPQGAAALLNALVTGGGGGGGGFPWAGGGSVPPPAAPSHPAPLPPWADGLVLWYARQPPPPSDAQLPAEQLPGACARLGAWLGAEVLCVGAGVGAGAAAAAPLPPGPGGAAKAPPLPLRAAVSGGVATVGVADADALLGAWARRGGGAAAAASQVAPLAAVWGSAPAEADAAAPLVALVRSRLAARACQALARDQDDLYFAGGRTHSELMAALPTLPPGFVSAMMAHARTAADVVHWSKLLKGVLHAFEAWALSDPQGLETPLRRLDAATAVPQLLTQLASQLATEAQLLATFPSSSSAHPLGVGRTFEKTCVLWPVLAAAPFVDVASALAGRVVSRGADAFTSLRGYPTNARDIEATKSLLQGQLGRLHDATAEVLKRLLKLKGEGVPPAAGREAVVGWLAAMALASESRLQGGELGALQAAVRGGAAAGGGASADAALLSLTAVALRLCRPFVGGYLTRGAKWLDLFERHLQPSYYTTQRHRLGCSSLEPSLAGGRGAQGGGAGADGAGGDAAPTAAAAAGGASTSTGAAAAAAPPRSCLVSELSGAGAGPSFVADAFFLAQRFVHVGLMPAVNRYQELMKAMAQRNGEGEEDEDADGDGDEAGGGASSRARRPPRRETLLASDCCLAQLLDPALGVDAVQFVALQLQWLRALLEAPGGAGLPSFHVIPEAVVSDGLAWLTFVIHAGAAEYISTVDIGALMAAVVCLLEHPEQVRSVLVQSKLVNLLLAMIAPQIDVQRRSAGALGRTVGRTGEAALVASVLGSPAVQTGLVPALMRVYGGADFVEGLDVDKDSFDKFNLRHAIDLVFLELWRDERARRVFARLAAQQLDGSDPTRLFPRFLTALLDDLMYLLKDSLERLQDIAAIEASRADAHAWRRLSPSERADKEAFYSGQQGAASGFLRLALSTLQLLNTLASAPDVAPAFLAPPLLGRVAYTACHFVELLVGPRCAAMQVANPERYSFNRPQLIESVAALMVQLGRHPSFLAALPAEDSYDAALLAQAAAALNKAHRYQAADQLEALARAVAAVGAPVPRTGAGGGAAAVNAAAAAAGWVFSSPPPEDLEAEYAAQLAPLALGVWDATAPGAYNSEFARRAAEASGDAPEKAKRLSREMRAMGAGGRTPLPVHPSGALFVRHHVDRLDMVRAVISGPEDSPYEGGLFVFDAFFPPAYPTIPPLMVLDTTGGGRVRFNPNAYADGKVCLSLLGTWHGGDASEKWDPVTSSLFQILLSIQGMVLVPDPYFNEPNVERMRGTPEGAAASLRYNAELRCATLRWAVLGHLRAPPPGLEEVVASHFRVMRHRIMATTARWLAEVEASADPPTRAMRDRTLALAQEVYAELAKLE